MVRMTDADKSAFDALADYMRDFNDVSKLTPELQGYAEETERGLFLRHPLVYQVWGIHPHEANKIVSAKRDELREAIREKRWYTFIAVHERPYRLYILRRIYERGWIDQDELRKLLASWWTDTELPEHSQEEARALFRDAVFTTDDSDGWNRQPDRITVYRGVDGEFEQTAEGMAWTTDFNVARFFARRHGDGGQVYEYILDKTEALAWFRDRGESEIILDFAEGGKSDSDEIELHTDYSE
jgi:hypothetical protein